MYFFPWNKKDSYEDVAKWFKGLLRGIRAALFKLLSPRLLEAWANVGWTDMWCFMRRSAISGIPMTLCPIPCDIFFYCFGWFTLLFTSQNFVEPRFDWGSFLIAKLIFVTLRCKFWIFTSFRTMYAGGDWWSVFQNVELTW